MSEIYKFYNTIAQPALDGGADLGAASFRWLRLYLQTGIVSDTTTGIKIGTATTQKLGFFNATPVTQQSSTTDIRTALINLGFIASGGASPLDLNGGNISTTGTVSAGTLEVTSGTNFIFDNDELISYDDDVVFY